MENDVLSRKTMTALNGIPFDNLIASPLNACINAQAQSAYTTLRFIDEVGFTTKKVDNVEVKDAVQVYFSYVSAGETVQLCVPLLTIVPIPFISIETIDLNFLVTVNGVENSADETTSTNVYSEDYKREAAFRRSRSDFKTSVSTKRDSKGTQDSQFSIEATMDVKIHAKSDSMPAGMAKVLEIFSSAIEIQKPLPAAEPAEPAKPAKPSK